MNSTFRSIPLTAIALVALCMAAVLTSSTAFAQAAAQVDNSAQNKDQDLTADKQSNAKIDRITTAKIRRVIVADRDLSMYAHNIKIISQNGAVTLKGPVKSDDEKRVIVAKAVAVAGSADKVTDEISIKQ